MASNKFGTNAIGGLNVETAPNLIQDHELQESLNGATEKAGRWSPAKGPLPQYTGTAISSGCVGRMGGADHLVWTDGNMLYDDDVAKSVADSSNGSGSIKIMPVSDSFLILGTALRDKTLIYDGNHVRDLGPWDGDLYGDDNKSNVFVAAAPTALNVATVTEGSPTTFTTDEADHGLSAGDRVYITGMNGLDQMDNRVHTVATADDPDTTTFTIAEDSTNYTAYDNDGSGTIYKDACGLDPGEYSYFQSCVIELKDGTVIESDLYPVKNRVVDIDYDEERPFIYIGPDLGESVTISAKTERVRLVLYAKWVDYEDDDVYYISGVKDTDYLPKIRLYRTKMDGYERYLVHEFANTDLNYAEVPPSSGDGYYYTDPYWDTTHDTDLGALYTYDIAKRRTPPYARHAAINGARLMLNDKDNPRRVYFSNDDSTEHFGAMDYVVLPDDVTGLVPVGRKTAATTASGIYLIGLAGGLPEVVRANSTVGTEYGDAMCQHGDSALFLRADGLYTLDAIGVTRVSTRAFGADDIGTPKAVVVTGDKILVHGDEASYCGYFISGGYEWHQVDLDNYNYISADSTGALYGFNTTQIDKILAGAPLDGKIVTKMFGDWGTYNPVRLVVDVEGSGDLFARLVGNRTEEDLGRIASGEGYRRRIERLSLPRPRGEFFHFEFTTSGDLSLNGWWMEVER